MTIEHGATGARFDHVPVTSIGDAVAQLTRPSTSGEVHLVAGGTSVMPRIRRRTPRGARLIDISGVPGLGFVRERGTVLEIGSLASLEQIAGSPLVRRAAPLLASACAKVASPAVRNMATIGGSLYPPHSDPAVALVALGARLVLHTSSGTVTSRAVDFLTGSGSPGGHHRHDRAHVLRQITLPAMLPETHVRYTRWSPRSAAERPAVTLAASLRGRNCHCTEAVLVLGGAVPVPLPLTRAAEKLTGARLTPELVASAAEEGAAELAAATDPPRSNEPPEKVPDAPCDSTRENRAHTRHVVAAVIHRTLLDLSRELT